MNSSKDTSEGEETLVVFSTTRRVEYHLEENSWRDLLVVMAVASRCSYCPPIFTSTSPSAYFYLLSTATNKTSGSNSNSVAMPHDTKCQKERWQELGSPLDILHLLIRAILKGSGMDRRTIEPNMSSWDGKPDYLHGFDLGERQKGHWPGDLVLEIQPSKGPPGWVKSGGAASVRFS